MKGRIIFCSNCGSPLTEGVREWLYGGRYVRDDDGLQHVVSQRKNIDLGNSVRAFGGTGNDCINMRNHAGVEGGDGDYDIDAYAHALVSGGEGNDAIWVHEYSYVYGGNAAIANYSGQKVKWASDYTGIGFNDNNFMINSSYGTLSWTWLTASEQAAQMLNMLLQK